MKSWRSTAIYLLTMLLSHTAATADSTACNNCPQLCSKTYNEVTYLGAHDSPFMRDPSNDYSLSGNQYYNTTIQLDAGVRLLTAQVQLNSENALHICHTSCDLLDAGPLNTWLSEVKAWMDSNPNNVVTIILVNGANASAASLASEYSAAGITSQLAYRPTGSTSSSQKWPTLQEMIDSGTRLVTFVESISDNSAAPYLIDQFTYVFENNYNNNSPTEYTCKAWQPSNVAGDTATAISAGMLPLMNHFLYELILNEVQAPNASYANVTNAPSGGVGNLGSALETCTGYYGKAPTFILVDFFNVGPAIESVDKANGVTDPVGRTGVAHGVPLPPSAGTLLSSVGIASLAVDVAASLLAENAVASS